MEVAEQLSGSTFISMHALAYMRGALPAFTPAESLRHSVAIGKAVVYARRSTVVEDTSAWLDDPTLRDVPHSGERFRAGQPVCTVLATGRTSSECYRALASAASSVYARLDREPSRAGQDCHAESAVRRRHRE
jgi:predicted ATP-grasp superfamily ATP-dependent carboligase